jgi:signal transduction histidine kinase
MRLSEFLLTHREQIMADWVAFARSRGATGGTMDLPMLRDHASEMLDAIAKDLKTPQSKVEQADKSEGKSDADPDPATPDTAAQAHGAARAESGFTVEEMVSEYRALRATVVRLWIDAAGELALKDLQDLVRFNESIDQDLAESTSRFAQDLDQSKEMFLAMLGHDLRAPLGAIIGSAHVMVNAEQLPKTLLKSASVILNSGQRMDALVGDLLDFTRSRLGRGGIPIVRADVDIAKACRQTVEEIAALYPQRVVNFDATGKLQGQWDAARVSQALSNVISNAIQYGSDTTPINVTLRGDADEVELAVQNCGPVIPANQLKKIFDPMHRIEGDKPAEPTSNLGLGLYITERIVAAHGGTIGVESSDRKGTTFTIHLPTRIRTEASLEPVGSKKSAPHKRKVA